MKCPKCGSKIKENKDRDVVWDRGRTAFCNKCHIEYRIDDETNDIIYTQPTTAEMLLWLVENNYVITRSLPSYEMSGSICKAFESYPSFRFGYIGMDRPLITLAEAIKQAYEWAKKEELNVKN